MDAQEQLAFALHSARQRLWAADAACYYAQRRFSQTENPKDRLIWERYQKESQEAVEEVRAAEKALARASPSSPANPDREALRGIKRDYGHA